MNQFTELLTSDEVATLCRCSQRTLSNWIAAGTFPAPLARRGRSKRLWPRPRVEAWLRGDAPPVRKTTRYVPVRKRT